MNLKTFEELFDEIKVQTKNFHEVTPYTIAENSQRIAVFRTIMGLSAERFAKLCKRSKGVINYFERKKRKLSIKTAETYFKYIKIDPTRINKEQIVKRYKLFLDRSRKGISILPKKQQILFVKVGTKAALETRKKNLNLYFQATRKGLKNQRLTKQELKIVKMLSNKGISFQTHETVGKENIDIVIPNNIPILINCKCVRNIKNLTDHVRKLIYQAYRIKYYNKNIIYICVLGSVNEDLTKDKIPIGAMELIKEICDAYFIDENLNELENYVSELISITSSPNRLSVGAMGVGAPRRALRQGP